MSARRNRSFSNRTSADAPSGCIGCLGGVLATLVVLALGGAFRGGGSGSSDVHPAPFTVYDDTPVHAPEPTTRETLYLHFDMNLRQAPGSESARVRTVRRGERVEVGGADERGWAPVYESGAITGYLYRASPHLRSSPPPVEVPGADEALERRAPAGASAICRDGTYSYSRHRRGTCSWHGGVQTWL